MIATVPDTLASAPVRRRRPARPPTQERYVPDTAPPGIPAAPQIRQIQGRQCTDRPGIAILAGVAAGRAIDVRAGRDPDFPQPLEKIGRSWWYPLDGPDGVDAYVQKLYARGEAGRPPAVDDGDPRELLDPDGAAAAMHIDRSTLDHYVRLSRPYWQAAALGETLPGYPQLPRPDVETELTNNLGVYTHREWYRATLAAHQATRPGITVRRGKTSE
ncbi:hypothetical protein AB0M47_20925 [Hamadaea sp. NPDC051192]|uniref:hypothetical protein n=1 Tax=Hamadaea sp. NPDC051192 TaxID=3154940 RepID=UPI0034369579